MSQTMQRQTNEMSVWLLFAGVVIGIVGAIVRKHAENVGEFLGVVGSRAVTSNPMTAAPADWGLGLLIVGAVVTLAGLIVIAGPSPK
jgi:hypothetical protein